VRRKPGCSPPGSGHAARGIGLVGRQNREFPQHLAEGGLDAAHERVLAGEFLAVLADQRRGIDLEHHKIS
jgi:hypothetical protein